MNECLYFTMKYNFVKAEEDFLLEKMKEQIIFRKEDTQ